MARTIVSDITIDELFDWVSSDGNNALVERSSKFLSTFIYYGQVDPETQLPTELSRQASRDANDLRSILAVYQLVSQRIELLENT